MSVARAGATAAIHGRIAEALRSLLDGKIPASIEADGLEEGSGLREVVAQVNRLKDALGELWGFVIPLSSGQLSVSPPATRNPMASPFKTLHARLRHMTWQARQVTAGDYGQRLEFLGEFSESFNTMVEMIASRERALQESNRELSSALDKLGAAQAQLVEAEKLSAMGRLLAQFSHELNNPLNAVQNNIGPAQGYFDDLRQLLSEVREKATAHPELSAYLEARLEALEFPFIVEDGAKTFQDMSESCRRMREIHRNLTVFLRGGVGNQVEEEDVNECLRSTSSMLKRRCATEVHIELDLGPVPKVRLARGAIHQVFFNLLRNALDAIGEAGCVSIRSEARDGRIVVSVEDSGPGVPEAIRARIFEPFFTTKEIGKGTGLGLPTSQGIIHRLGGKLYLDADHASGARFVVELPLPVRAEASGDA